MELSAENTAELKSELESVDVKQAGQFRKSNSNWDAILEPELSKRLGVAAAQGNLHLVKNLLDHGAILNPTDHRTVEPLWYATTNGHIDIVEYLLKSGARIKGYSGRNAFLPAVVSGNTELVSVFLKYGADPDVDIMGWPKPTKLAKALGHFQVVQLLADFVAGQHD